MERKKILIVDDEASVRFLLSEELCAECDVSCCASGKEALEVFSESQPDLVITDFEMPEMNGDKLIEIIKGINSKIPIIVFTGVTPLPESEADETLGKSSILEKLHASVRKFLTISPLPVPV